MDRREVLKTSILFGGYALSASTVSAILQACKRAAGADWTPVFLSSSQAAVLSEMAETIIPHTGDSPGAKDVGVPQLIDVMLSKYIAPEQAEKVREGLDTFDQQCREAKGKSFIELSAEERLEYLNAVNHDAITRDRERTVPDPEYYPFFLNLKGSIISAYFSSEEVGTKVLAYDPLPGEYIACAPLSELGGRQWSI
jgi:hypothetical protein